MPQDSQKPASRRPALFDVQVNGFAGVDFQDDSLTARSLRLACDALRQRYVHRILLTLITDEVDRLRRRLERIEEFRRQDPVIRETVCGYHLEGPWLSPLTGFAGAHPPQHMLDPEIACLERLQSSAGRRVRLVTLAPERRGSADFIRAAAQMGIVISLGHTNARHEDIDAAIDAGATLCTHLGNAVPPELPRHDNVMQRLLARDELTACLIPDGIHLPPFVLRNFYRAKPAGKVVLTTDAMSAAASPPGTYQVGPHRVEVGPDLIVRLPGRSQFAGSALTLDRGIANASRWLELEFDAAWHLGAEAPAAQFGIELPTIDFP